MTAVVDAGILYALVDRADPAHAPAVEALEVEPEAIVVPQVALPEICYLIGSRIGSSEETAFVRYLAESDWRLEPLTNGDIERIVSLLAEHAPAGLGFVDAAVVALAERMGATRIYTLNATHFDRVRPTHIERLEIRSPLPA